MCSAPQTLSLPTQDLFLHRVSLPTPFHPPAALLAFLTPQSCQGPGSILCPRASSPCGKFSPSSGFSLVSLLDSACRCWPAQPTAFSRFLLLAFWPAGPASSSVLSQPPISFFTLQSASYLPALTSQGWPCFVLFFCL